MSKDKFVEPRPGDILLVYPESLIQDGIELVEEIELLRERKPPPGGRPIYSHVAVVVDNGYVIEALGHGLVKNHAYNYRESADVWTYSHLSDGQRKRIVRQATSMLERGYRYSLWDIFILFIRLTTGLRLPWRQMRSLVCSVFAYDCYWAAGLKVAQYQNCAPSEISEYGVLEFAGRY